MVKHNKLAEELMWQKGIWNEHDDVSGKCYSCWGQPVGDKTVVGLVGERGTVVGVAAELHIVDTCSFFLCESDLLRLLVRKAGGWEKV